MFQGLLQVGYVPSSQGISPSSELRSFCRSDEKNLWDCHDVIYSFEGLAALSKNSVGWFYGLKLYFLFNDKGEIVRLSITPGNVDDRKGLKGLLAGLLGKIFGDRGYLGKDFFEKLWQEGIQMINRIRKNMKNKLMPLWNRFYLDQRMTVESIFSSLKSC